MGSMLYARCKCGYTNSVLLGGGMSNFTYFCGLPFYCENCKTMFAGNAYDEEAECSDCGSKKVIPYDDDRVCRVKGEIVGSWSTKVKPGKDLELSDGQYLCPACGKFDLKFESYGLFD